MVTATSVPAAVDLRRALETAFPVDIETASSNSARELDVFVIPQGAEPRWIILGNPRDALPVLKSWAPFNLKSRLQWAGVLSAAAVNMLARLPGVIVDRATVDLTYWKRHLPDFSDDWTPVIHVGNASHTRKIILFFVGGDGHFRAVAKTPLLPEAAKAILNEWQVLHNMRVMRTVPRAVFRDPDRGIAAQAWLEGKPVSRKLILPHIDFLVSLSRAGRTIRLSALKSAIEPQIESLDPSLNRDPLHRALALLDFDVPLPAVIEHRDFAPWNLKRLPDGATGAIDWEWATMDGLPCQDLFRWFYIQDALFDGPGDVWPRLRADRLVTEYRRRIGLPPGAMKPLAAFYLLRVISMDSSAGDVRLVRHSYRQIEHLVTSEL